MSNRAHHYPFGGNPTASDPAVLPAPDAAGALLSIVYQRADSATDLTFTVQETPDPATGSRVASAGTGTVLSDDGAVQRIRFTAAPGTAGKKFLRVLVTQP